MTRDTDPQALRDASTAWREMGRQLEEMVRDLNNGVRSTRESDWQGASAEAFDEDWSQLRQVVDEALPVFRMAADELDGAADAMAESDVATRVQSADVTSSGGGSGESAGVVPASSSDSSSSSSGTSDPRGGGGYQAMFAVSALSQMGVMLGSTFGRRGGGGGQSSRSRLTRSEAQPESTLPRSADPFGSGADAPADDRRRGGLGIARGKRQPARNGEPADSPESGERQAAAVRFGGPEPEPSASKPEEPSPLDRPINRPDGGADRPAGAQGADGDSATAPTAGEPRGGTADREPAAEPTAEPAADSGGTRTASGTPDSGGEDTPTRPDTTGERPAGDARGSGDGAADTPATRTGAAPKAPAADSEATSEEPATAGSAPAGSATGSSSTGSPASASPAAGAPAEPPAEPQKGPGGARLEKASGVEREDRSGRAGPAGEDTVDGREPTSRRAARPGAFG